jgi:hypothetical protein
MPLDVVCPHCKRRYHETTDLYDPDVSTRGFMLRLKDEHREAGLPSFPETGSMYGNCLECPGCGGSYVAYSGSQNRVMIYTDDPRFPTGHKCPYCTFRAKRGQGRSAHIRMIHPEKVWKEVTIEHVSSRSGGAMLETERVKIDGS